MRNNILRCQSIFIIGKYAGTKANVDNELSHIDKANIKLISRIEKNLEEAQRDPELIGNWHYYPIMPASAADHIKFFENGTFKYVFWASKIYGYVSFGGIYDTENDTLSLTTLTEEIILYKNVVISIFGDEILDGIQLGGKYFSGSYRGLSGLRSNGERNHLE